MVSGICLTQVTQLVAQNLTSTTLPRRSCMLDVLPSMLVKATSGAIGAGRHTNQAPMPAATRTARERMSFFIYLMGIAWTPSTVPPPPDSMGAGLCCGALPDCDPCCWVEEPDRRRASSRLMTSNRLTTLDTPPTSEAAVAA